LQEGHPGLPNETQHTLITSPMKIRNLQDLQVFVTTAGNGSLSTIAGLDAAQQLRRLCLCFA
jgi:hypothetical protein